MSHKLTNEQIADLEKQNVMLLEEFFKKPPALWTKDNEDFLTYQYYLPFETIRIKGFDRKTKDFTDEVIEVSGAEYRQARLFMTAYAHYEKFPPAGKKRISNFLFTDKHGKPMDTMPPQNSPEFHEGFEKINKSVLIVSGEFQLRPPEVAHKVDPVVPGKEQSSTKTTPAAPPKTEPPEKVDPVVPKKDEAPPPRKPQYDPDNMSMLFERAGVPFPQNLYPLTESLVSMPRTNTPPIAALTGFQGMPQGVRLSDPSANPGKLPEDLVGALAMARGNTPGGK